MENKFKTLLRGQMLSLGCKNIDGIVKGEFYKRPHYNVILKENVITYLNKKTNKKLKLWFDEIKELNIIDIHLFRIITLSGGKHYLKLN